MAYVRSHDCFNIIKEEIKDIVNTHLFNLDIDSTIIDKDDIFYITCGRREDMVVVQHEKGSISIYDGVATYTYPCEMDGDYDDSLEIIDKFLSPLYQHMLEAVYTKYNNTIAWSEEFDTYPDLQVGNIKEMDLNEFDIEKITDALRAIKRVNGIHKKDINTKNEKRFK